MADELSPEEIRLNEKKQQIRKEFGTHDDNIQYITIEQPDTGVKLNKNLFIFIHKK